MFLRCIIETCLELLLAAGTPEGWLLCMASDKQLRTLWEKKKEKQEKRGAGREVKEEGNRERGAGRGMREQRCRKRGAGREGAGQRVHTTQGDGAVFKSAPVSCHVHKEHLWCLV